jgi:hypothetical protein
MVIVRGLLIAILAAIPIAASAFDNGQYENIDPNIRSWFRGVKSHNGVPCCSMADGHPTDFKVDEGGHYFVPISGIPNGPDPVWIVVPPEAVITSQGNPNDTAIVWYVRQETGIFIRCFVPVGGV